MSVNNIFKKAVKQIVPQSLINQGRCAIEAAKILPYYVSGSGKAPPPESVTIDITFKCNCRCIMCALYGDHRESWCESSVDKELTTQQWKDVIDQLKYAGINSICFTGGEPMIRKDLLDIIEYAINKNIAINILTSGGLLSQEISKKIVEIGVDDISISIDGPKEIHNIIRRTSVFDAAVKGIQYIQNEKKRYNTEKPSISIACTIQKLNENHLHELVAIANSLQVHLSFSPLFYTSHENENRSFKLAGGDDATKDEDQNVLDTHRLVNVEILTNELNLVRKEADRLNQSIYLPLESKEDIESRFYKPDHSILNKCLGPWLGSRIDPYGNVYPCSVNMKCGNVLETDFGEIWNGPRYLKFRKTLKKMKLFPRCAKCCTLTPEKKVWDYIPCVGP